MKVLLIGQIPVEMGGSYTTGVANVVNEIFKGLCNCCDVEIYATNYNENLNTKNKISEKIHGYTYLKLAFLLSSFLIRKPGLFIKYFLEFRREGYLAQKMILYFVLIDYYVKTLKPDIINAHGIRFAPILNFVNHKVPVIISMHGITVNDVNAVNFNKRRGEDILKLYTHAASFIKNVTFLTEEMELQGRNLINLYPENAKIISNGINGRDFRYCEFSRAEIRRELEIDLKELVFISVGSLSKLKNHYGFIEYLHKNNIHCTYLIIGKGDETKQKILEAKEKCKGIIRIILIDYINNKKLYKYYSAADKYALPSTAEGQSLVALEALACGLTLYINKDIEGTIGLYESYKKYYRSFKFNDEFLKEDLEIDVDRNFLSSKINDEYNWNKIALQYFEYYSKVLNDNIKE